MNAIATKSIAATALVALLGAASLAFMQVEPAPAPQEVLKFERVVIVGKRANVAEAEGVIQLPRVVVEGRSSTQLAKAPSCSTTATC